MKMNVRSGKTAILCISLFLCIVCMGCDQEPLFWDIAHEYPPISPDIGGAPTKIVEKGTSLYIGNTSGVWEYDTSNPDPNWNLMSVPPFRVRDIAVANSALFALDTYGKIWTWSSSNWTDITYTAGTEKTQKLFGIGNNLFVSEQTGDLNGKDAYKTAYTVKCLNTSGSVQGTLQNTGLIMGVASGPILGTFGDGLLKWTGSAFSPDGFAGQTIVGLTEYSSDIYIVMPSAIYKYAGSSLIVSGGNFSGAIAGWSDGTSTHNLLLVGLRSSSGSFGFGYRELEITGSTGIRIPGEGIEINPSNRNELLSSVKISSQYVSAIGKNAIYYLHVMPSSFKKADDGDIVNKYPGYSPYTAPARPVIFAVTAKSGLWSYRTRIGRAQWNGEDRTPF